MNVEFLHKREKVIQLAQIIIDAAVAIEQTFGTIPEDQQKAFKEFVEKDPRMELHKKTMEGLGI
jgi:hypothetical protein